MAGVDHLPILLRGASVIVQLAQVAERLGATGKLAAHGRVVGRAEGTASGRGRALAGADLLPICVEHGPHNYIIHWFGQQTAHSNATPTDLIDAGLSGQLALVAEGLSASGKLTAHRLVDGRADEVASGRSRAFAGVNLLPVCEAHQAG